VTETLLLDETGWHVVVAGGDRVRFVNGMCMGNVAAIAPGGFLKTASLSPKGRLLAVFDVVPREEDLVLVAAPGTAEPLRALLERHAIADDVAISLAELPVHRWWGAPAEVWSAPPMLTPPPRAPSDPAAIEQRRIAAGLPRYGVDVTDAHFPFETPLVQLIDYKKGCYVGQEPVARVAARGSASKQLVGLAIEGDGAVAPGTPIAVGGKADAGSVTSSAPGPKGGAIALGWLPRGSWDVGTAVAVAGRAGQVVALPMG
jgi:folate-binding protein YgfZ